MTTTLTAANELVLHCKHNPEALQHSKLLQLQAEELQDKIVPLRAASEEASKWALTAVSEPATPEEAKRLQPDWIEQANLLKLHKATFMKATGQWQQELKAALSKLAT